MWSVLLFANNRGDPLARPEIIWGMVGLTVALLIGAAVIYAVDKWRKRATAPDDETSALTSFRAMYESGEITEAEYAELRRRVAEKVKKPVASVTASTPPGAPPGATTGATPGAAPAAQPGERATVNPPAPPSGTPESHPPPSSA